MQLRRILLLSIAVVCTVAIAALAATPPPTKSINWTTDCDKALKSGKPIMIDFYTDWCGWCKRLDKDTYPDKRVIELSRKFVCVKLDGDKNESLVSKFKVTGYPTILFLNAKGKEVHRVVGYEKPDQFVKDMKIALGKAK